MEESLEHRHLARQEATVLADAVTAHRRRPAQRVQTEEIDGLRFRLRSIDPARPHPLHQARGAMRRAVPLVHAAQHSIVPVNGDHRALSNHVQVRVGHDRRYFDDVVERRVQPGHLKVYPDEIVLDRHCGIAAAPKDA